MSTIDLHVSRPRIDTASVTPSIDVFSQGTQGARGADSGISYASVAALRSLGAAPAAGTRVDTRGYASNGDGGGGVWWWDAASTATDDGGTVVKITAEATGRWKRLYDGPLDPHWFGAKGDGLTDDYLAIRAANDRAAEAGRIVQFRALPYLCSRYIQATCEWRGAGVGKTIFDFSSADDTDLYSSRGCIVAVGTFDTASTGLGANPISSNLTTGGTALTLRVAAALSRNDLIALTNTTNASWSAATGRSTTSHQGEFMLVESASGTTVNVMTPIMDDYTAGASLLFGKVTPVTVKLSGFTVKARPSSGDNGSYGIWIILGRDCVIADVDVYNTDMEGISLSRCFNTVIRNVTANSKLSTPTGSLNEYAIGIGNSQEVLIDSCHLVGSQHAVPTGGGTSEPIVPCRHIRIKDSILASTDSAASRMALGLHDTTEFAEISGCVLYGGAGLGGNHIYLHHCDIFSNQVGQCIWTSNDSKGWDYRIEHNFIRQTVAADGTVSPSTLCRILGSVATDDGGLVRIADNRFEIPYAVTSAIYVNNNAAANDGADVEIIRNTIPHGTGTTSQYAIWVDADASQGFRNVTIESNTLTGRGIRVDNGCKRLNINRNMIYSSSDHGVTVANTTTPSQTIDWLSACGNIIHDPALSCLNLRGDATTTYGLVQGNSLLRAGTYAVQLLGFLHISLFGNEWGGTSGIVQYVGSVTTAVKGGNVIVGSVVHDSLAPTTLHHGPPLVVSKQWNPPSVANGGNTTTTVTVYGAKTTMSAAAGHANNTTGGVTITAAVTADDTVTVTLTNNSGGAVDYASGTLTVAVYQDYAA